MLFWNLEAVGVTKFYRQTANCDIRIATPPADIMWRLCMMLFL